MIKLTIRRIADNISIKKLKSENDKAVSLGSSLISLKIKKSLSYCDWFDKTCDSITSVIFPWVSKSLSVLTSSNKW